MPKLWTVALAVVTLGAGGASAYDGDGADRLKSIAEGTASSFAAPVLSQFFPAQPELSLASQSAFLADKGTDAALSADALRAVSAGVNLEPANAPTGGSSDKIGPDSLVTQYAAKLFANQPSVDLSSNSLAFDAAAPGLGQMNLRTFTSGSGIPELGGR